MPFSSLTDPVDPARAEATPDAAWTEIKATRPDADEPDRSRLAFSVASLIAIVVDDGGTR